MPRLRFLKLGTRPLADTGEGRPPGSPSAELGLEAPRPTPPILVGTSLFLGTASLYLECQACGACPNFNLFSPEWKRVEFS